MKHLLILFLLLIIVSCDKAKDSSIAIKNDTITVYNELTFAKHGGYRPGNKKIFKIIDTACINGNKRAEKMMKKGLHTYFFGAGFNCSYEKQEYFKKAYLEKGIRIDYRYSSCLGEMPPGKFGYQCYEKAMNAGFKKRYGSARVDSINKAYEKVNEEYRKTKNN
jgi:hypothetical protein